MTQASFKYHKYMIKSAPYGQLPIVIQNLQKISHFNIQSQQSQQTLRQYNEEHLSIAKSSQKQSSYPIFKIARDPNGRYVDQLNRQRAVDLELPEPVVELLQILSKKVSTYVDKYYRQPCASQVYMEITQQETLNVHVAFTSKNVQLNNFYTGEWNSVWLINKESIQGKVSIRSHIFQSGNVQMNQNRQLSRQFQFSADMQQNAKKIIKTIQEFECQTQASLSQTYQQMPQSFFKHLRRIMPVTKTPMTWNINSLKMAKNLLQNKK